MVELGVEYQVEDGLGRKWGSVIFEHRVVPPNKHAELADSYSGQLQPAEQFEEVRPIFLAHEKLLEQTTEHDDRFNRSCSEIAGLNVVLRNTRTGKEVFVSPMFVSRDLLFTC